MDGLNIGLKNRNRDILNLKVMTKRNINSINSEKLNHRKIIIKPGKN
jgi:hypothetical protein